MVEAQFVSFLLDRLESQIVDLRGSNSTTADEMQIYLDQLKTLTTSLFPVSDTPQPMRPRRNQREA